MKKVLYTAVGSLFALPIVAMAQSPDYDGCDRINDVLVCKDPVSVSEPSTLALLAAGLAVAALLKFKNRNK